MDHVLEMMQGLVHVMQGATTAADLLRLAAPIMRPLSGVPLSPGSLSAQPKPVSSKPHTPKPHNPRPTPHTSGPPTHRTLQFTSQPRLLLFGCSLLHCARSRS